MSKKFLRLGTAGYVSSSENEDVLATLISAQGWTAGLKTTSLEFLPKADCVVEINGVQSTVTANALLRVLIDDVNGGWVDSFKTMTGSVEYVLNVTF